nr:TMEM165/GDT1 family protein [Magnetospira sp. QH-2]
MEQVLGQIKADHGNIAHWTLPLLDSFNTSSMAHHETEGGVHAITVTHRNPSSRISENHVLEPNTTRGNNMWWQTAGTTLAIIGLAEIGDKSQLVCMALAAKHGRVRPILFGAVLAFALLNGLAVIFGGALAQWLPQEWILGGVAVLFAGFGIHSLLHADEDEDDDTEERKFGSLFITTFLMIFLAELGDKTQIAVAGLAGIYPILFVWIGATVALAITSVIGAVAGKTVLGKLPIVWLHRFAGVLFLGMSAFAAWSLLSALNYV